MGIVYVGFILFCASALIKHHKRAKAQREAQRIAYEKELARIAKEQSRHAKELAKHEAWLKKHDEEIQNCHFRIEKAEDEIAHFCALADDLTAQRESAQAKLDDLRNRLFVANGGLSPEDIVYGDKANWSKTSDASEYAAMWAKTFDDGKSGKKSKNTDVEKMQKQASALENKIVKLDNQIFTAEQRIKKAEHDKYTAQMKLSA